MGGGLLGRPPLMPASQAVSGDGKHRDSQPHVCLQPAGAPQQGRVGSDACRVALAGRGGWASPAGWARGWVTWDMPEGCNSPKVHGSSRVLFSGMLLLLYGLLAPLALSLSRAHLPPPTKSAHLQGSAACGMPGGSRAMPSPKLGTLHARSPGPQVIFRPHATNPLMQSSDAVAGCAAVWPLMGRSSSSFPPVRL